MKGVGSNKNVVGGTEAARGCLDFVVALAGEVQDDLPVNHFLEVGGFDKPFALDPVCLSSKT